MLILWIVFLCPLVFSFSFRFNPIQFAVNLLFSKEVIPEQTPLIPLCPPNISIQLCLASTSFPLVTKEVNTPPSATMFTPISHRPKEISSQRRKQLLSEDKWKSYKYSNENARLVRLPEKERNAEPEEDYYRLHIQENTKNDSLTKVIKVEKINGQLQSHIGELRGVKTANILRVIDNPYTPSAQESSKPPENPENRSAPPTTPTAPTAPTPPTPPTAPQDSENSSQSIRLDTPVEAIALNYNNIPTQCADVRAGDTEAVSVCIECATNTDKQLQKDSAEILKNANLKNTTNLNNTFNTFLTKKLKGKICHGQNLISPIKNNFEKKCGNISFENYISKVLICESCKQKVPPALMLAMISLESSGSCFIKGDDGKSRGLFQINTTYHKKPPVCSAQEQAKIQTASLTELKNGLQCLENPISNLKKSIQILKGSYKTVNGKKSYEENENNYNCQSTGVNASQTNKWRKALAGYNGGPAHINRLHKMQKPQAISESQWNKMDEWEKIRLQYFFYTRADPETRMGNLAHVETALGNIGSPQERSKFIQLMGKSS